MHGYQDTVAVRDMTAADTIRTQSHFLQLSAGALLMGALLFLAGCATQVPPTDLTFDKARASQQSEQGAPAPKEAVRKLALSPYDPARAAQLRAEYLSRERQGLPSPELSMKPASPDNNSNLQPLAQPEKAQPQQPRSWYFYDPYYRPDLPPYYWQPWYYRHRPGFRSGVGLWLYH